MDAVVVLGAGPAGAAAALCLGRRGHGVTVLDRDSLPPPCPGQGERSSVPHARQGHSFLARGTRVLDEEAPGVVASLVAAGARRVSLQHDPGHWNLLSSRRLFDAALHDALWTAPGVRLLAGTAATGLLIKEASATAPPHVFGVRTPDGPLRADVVIDASGRHSPVPRWLAAYGIKIPVLDDPTPFFYLTRHYCLSMGTSFPSVGVPIIAALDYGTALAFPEDSGHFQLTVQLDVRDPVRRALRESATFDRILASVPLTASWLAVGEPVSDPEPFASMGNRRKRCFHETAVVTGLLMVGDAAVHTNPTAGRGVALALAHSQALANLLDLVGNASYDPAALTEQWERITSSLFDPWLLSQMQIDRERRGQIRASVEGHHWTACDDIPNRLTRALAAPPDCEAVACARDRLFNLLVTPEEICKDRVVMRHLFREAQRSSAESSPVGPSRREFERLAARCRHAGR
jgi:2-polyprenyl-6-methoxyphenol hydroxylase-like FAD-dependent oxidoreductase